MPLLNADALAGLRNRQTGAARSNQSCQWSSVQTWLNCWREASEVSMPGPRAKYYTLATDATLKLGAAADALGRKRWENVGPEEAQSDHEEILRAGKRPQ